jgi:hypothetical protein
MESRPGFTAAPSSLAFHSSGSRFVPQNSCGSLYPKPSLFFSASFALSIRPCSKPATSATMRSFFSPAERTCSLKTTLHSPYVCPEPVLVNRSETMAQKTRFFRTRRGGVAQRSVDLVDALPISVHVLKLSDACLQRRHREPSQPPDRLLLRLRQINLDKVELLARQLSLHIDALAKRRFRCVLRGGSPGGTPVVCLPLRSLGAERAHKQSQLVSCAPVRPQQIGIPCFREGSQKHSETGLREHKGEASKNGLFETPFTSKNEHFTKTGSGQT